MMDDIKYFLSEIHDWIIQKPRPVEAVVVRYTQGVRHLTSIYDDNVYDDNFCDFIWNWEVAVGKAKGCTGRVKDEIILSHFVQIKSLYSLKRFITCAKYCLTERMEGMTKYFVRRLEEIYDAKRVQEIMRECGLE